MLPFRFRTTKQNIWRHTHYLLRGTAFPFDFDILYLSHLAVSASPGPSLTLSRRLALQSSRLCSALSDGSTGVCYPAAECRRRGGRSEDVCSGVGGQGGATGPWSAKASAVNVCCVCEYPVINAGR